MKVSFNGALGAYVGNEDHIFPSKNGISDFNGVFEKFESLILLDILKSFTSTSIAPGQLPACPIGYVHVGGGRAKQ